MGDFSLIGGGSDALEEGYDYTATNRTNITASGTTHTVGSYVELVSAANNIRPINKIVVSMGDYASSTTLYFLVNIAIGGAGSEQVIIPNLYCYTTSNANKTNNFQFDIPINIPSGQRISANCQSNGSSGVVPVSIILCRGSLSQGSGLGTVDAIGSDTATSTGVSVATNATINTFGSWVEITSSAAEAYKGFLVSGIRPSASWTNLNVAYQVSIGSAGNEEIIFSGHHIRQTGSEITTLAVSPFIPVGIAQGERIAIRAQTNVSNTDADLDYIIYGVR